MGWVASLSGKGREDAPLCLRIGSAFQPSQFTSLDQLNKHKSSTRGEGRMAGKGKASRKQLWKPLVPALVRLASPVVTKGVLLIYATDTKEPSWFTSPRSHRPHLINTSCQPSPVPNPPVLPRDQIHSLLHGLFTFCPTCSPAGFAAVKFWLSPMLAKSHHQHQCKSFYQW